MQYKKFAAATVASLAATVSAEGYTPGDVWSTLTPSGTYKGAYTDYTSTFGIAVQPIASSSSTSVAKRAVSQIGDGQIQAPTTTTTTVQKTTAAAVSQITDGQVQATTKTTTTVQKTTQAAVSQITDGQVQATTKTTTTVQKTTQAAVSQIGDGQIQATTAKNTEAAISQIGDGQVQATTAKNTEAAASQITDGQIQASTRVTSTLEPASGSSSASSASASSTGPLEINNVSCGTNSTLSMTLKGGILTDSNGRIGSVVANRQFQFDGPPPQAGAIYAAGWFITPEGNLAIGSNDVFYQCLSGNFHNLYEESIGTQCAPVPLEIVSLVNVNIQVMGKHLILVWLE
ncbi:hypothetical protein Kpol_2002p78 [Vanderwaltozyma polyspora DSM 70294]|uniref:Cell wall mannoprotein PIR1-like C-terminal domain-containing protein n=1 Tax=Vanderwaltozyma polyspora (strain ATCC 22028 / DSM 70294 / BCRC 21397 / CBS 2163 / NBRC 10782 / NRRL Y-8283 / UCD 57-17) TaxID=436907 RepID=A7TFJ3_VANPO|nr:uncharacterized protein Kpol_2002p78 [Vanderwaltozyma polyspora DSM 70294]EDO19007.1 hypothetical protein Kpol_2002p78 [Vanderwaltozyma polyspora DSM 70294]